MKKKQLREEDKYNKELVCHMCHNKFLVLTPEDYDNCICTCNKPLCTEKCEREHNGGYSIKEMRDMEEEWKNGKPS